MAEDIRIKTAIMTNPKIIMLISEHGDHGFVCLLRLWLFAANNKPDGDLSTYPDKMIESASGWRGEPGQLYSTLCEIGFLECNGDKKMLHDWSEHQKWVVGEKTRSKSASKKVLLRWCMQNIPKKNQENFRDWYENIYQYSQGDNTDSILAVYQQYRNSNTQGNTPLLSSPLPSPLPLPKDINEKPVDSKKPKFNHLSMKPEQISNDLWSAFIENRKFKKLQNTELALKTILNSFKKGLDAGYTYQQMIERYVSSGMQRFKAEWMQDNDKSQNHRDQYAMELLNAANNQDSIGHN